ncbi:MULTISPECIES: single-stranded DNA-binding protein [Cytobacillus]|uniref:Single-stranded DNA-binding protein n=1 Tax=Cytobacillus oceanisediminis TaxID=665099 RepID=A0ABX3CN01_9BACI|nr:single-stranded DNA-binding protein [Cytobacillus oceanisediminis]EFV75002.1 hypothetical protein HMPREF1013_04775 [Bacillus sp. 2_A_57_CT2]MCM3402928.1 single-stranded DNA-binding protein [Cytobacillus oceanisediminis]OHX45044.1 hypothetical protein BBV17_24275 [Cytobacillus oceanisediminis]
MLNEVKFIGNLTKDVELRKTASGKSVTNLDIALNYYVQSEKKTEFVQVILWEKQAEDANTYLSKGRQVYVEAKVVVRKRNIEGKNIPIPEFHGDKVLYLGAASNQNTGSSQQTSNNRNDYDHTKRGHDPFSYQNGDGMFNTSNNFNSAADNSSPFGR